MWVWVVSWQFWAPSGLLPSRLDDPPAVLTPSVGDPHDGEAADLAEDAGGELHPRLTRAELAKLVGTT